MRILDQVLGHQDIIAKLVDSFEKGRPGQTYLFVGPSGIGKRKVAWGLAQALLCAQSPRGCGRCPSCFRMNQGHHEGVLQIQPTGPAIKIEQAKEVLEFLSLKSLTGNRVIILDQAQLLNPQAANSLLKTLEEPPEGTFFFLIAPSIAGIMPTIRSRSRVVQFKPLSEADLSQRVKAPAWALRSAAGSFEKLGHLQEGPEQDLRKKAADILMLFVKDTDFLLSEVWRPEFKDRQQGQRILSYWLSYLKDAVYLQEGVKTSVVNLDQEKLLQHLAELPKPQILKWIQKSLKAEQALGANRDAQLVIEEFYINSRP